MRALRETDRGRAMLALTASAYQAGASMEDLAQDLGLTLMGVKHRLLLASVKLRPRGSPRVPLFEIVYLRAHGVSHERIARLHGTTKHAVLMRLYRAQAKRLSDILALDARQLAAYREALDGDGFPHPDALEIALEYAEGIAA